MSEEVTNVTLQVTEKAVTTGLNATTRIAEMFARLLRVLMEMSRERNASNAGRGIISGSKEKVKETDLTDLKPGYAAVRDLEKSAQKSGDTIATSEHGMRLIWNRQRRESANPSRWRKNCSTHKEGSRNWNRSSPVCRNSRKILLIILNIRESKKAICTLPQLVCILIFQLG